MSRISGSLGSLAERGRDVCCIRRLRVRLTWTSLVVLLTAAPAWSEEVTAEHDFRASNFNSQLLGYIGDDAAKYIKPSEDGLRMRFVAGDAPKAPVGIFWKSWVIGNFTTTARYEILECGLPKRGSGVGVELWIQLDNPTRDGIAFARQLYPKEGAILAFTHISTNEKGKRYGKLSKRPPTTDASKRGRIRLARVGNEVIASIAEGDAEQFKEVTRTTIDDVDVRIARLAAIPGGDPNATLDLRILDFQITGDLPGFDGVKLRSSKKRAAAGEPDAPDDVEPPRGPRWLLLGSILLLLGLAFAFVAVFLLVRMRHASAKAAPRLEPEDADADQPEAPSATVTLNCSACGQKIKVKESLMGKRVKCPGCGHAVPVPAE